MKNITILMLALSVLGLPTLSNASFYISTTLNGCAVKIDPDQSQSPEGSGKTCFFKDGKILVVGWGTMLLGRYKIDSKQKILSIFYPKTKQQDFSKYNSMQPISIKNGTVLIIEGTDSVVKIRPFDKDDKELFDIKKALEKELKVK